MTAFEIVNTVLNGVIALAAVLAAAVATAGLYTWRKQLRGQSEFAAATRLLRCAYRVKGAFQAVRAMIGMNKPDELMPKLQQALSEFSEAMADMDVLSPGLAKPAADAFRDCVHEYGNAVRRQKRMDSRKAEVSQEEYEQIDSVLWADPEDDALGRKLDDAMQTFEKLL
ncbi:MAG: hypothetical protein NT031_18825, partial [Planctomycetota bacterium]|nr:hypothetical protein [Planctomycetota bacterium]